MAAPRRSRTPAAPATGADSEAPPSLEAGLERLEAIVERLEQGDLELEAALASFEEGVALTRGCAAQLDAARRRIEVLVREGNELTERPFTESGESPEGMGGMPARARTTSTASSNNTIPPARPHARSSTSSTVGRAASAMRRARRYSCSDW